MDFSALMPRRSWFRFSIRSLLLLMLLIAAPLGWQLNRVRAQRRAVQAIWNSGGMVVFRDMGSYDQRLAARETPPATWTSWLLADEVVRVEYPWIDTSDLSHVEHFPSLEHLSYPAYAMSDSSLANLQGCRKLRTLTIHVYEAPEGFTGKTLWDSEERKRVRLAIEGALPDCNYTITGWFREEDY